MSNKIYFTPGPSQIYHTFETHFKSALKNDIPSISHRSKQFVSVIEETTLNLRLLLNLPEDYEIFFVNSANEAWDRIHQNLVLKHSHHFVNGAFSKKFYDFGIKYHHNSTQTLADDGQSFSNLEVPEETELIAITKNETSVGYTFTKEEIKTIRENNPEKLIALDVVSATPAVTINYNNVDTAYFSVQKAFGMPAGLGIWIVNSKCVEKASYVETKRSIGTYRSILSLKKQAENYQTTDTPNMLAIYILGKIAEDLLNYGIKRLHNDTIYKGTVLKQLDSHPKFKNFVDNKANQSLTTLVFETEIGQNLIEFLSSKKMVIGGGYGVHKKEHIRIANFPAHSKEATEQLVDLITSFETV